jgi:hypothetical protein
MFSKRTRQLSSSLDLNHEILAASLPRLEDPNSAEDNYDMILRKAREVKAQHESRLEKSGKGKYSSPKVQLRKNRAA